MITISTTITKYLHDKAKDKGIKWSRALEVGVLRLLNEHYRPEKGVSEEQVTELNKKERALAVMQSHILDLDAELTKLREEKQKK